jgi:nitrite reductase/ring-hydroxylating ferredoxin subunit
VARGERVIARSAEIVERGPGVRFEVERHGKPRPAFAVRVEGLVRAYENVCAHQSVELDWMPGEFFDEERRHLICATHGALYEPADGRCVAGPCLGARLVPLAVVERDGQVLLIE